MAFELPALPYEKNALEPHISQETLEYHYGKHHNTYVTKLNGLVEGTDNANKSLEDIIKSASGPLFNNAAQVWNHTFYWHCMKPGGSGNPHGKVADLIDRDLGGYDQFVKDFKAAGGGQFGSGWAWLVKKSDGSVGLASTIGAGNPMTAGDKPLLTCDVWEHAYYIDYRNARPKFVEAFWNVVNWDFVAKNFAG